MSIASHAQPVATDSDRNYALGIHLSPLAALVFGPAILAPVVLWLIRKDKSEFVDDHGRETINALLSFLLYHVVAVVTVIGLVVLPVLYIVGMISLVRGAIASGRGEFFRYPMTLRFLR
jgi:uncharacterized Tic20 family protein